MFFSGRTASYTFYIWWHQYCCPCPKLSCGSTCKSSSHHQHRVLQLTSAHPAHLPTHPSSLQHTAARCPSPAGGHLCQTVGQRSNQRLPAELACTTCRLAPQNEYAAQSVSGYNYAEGSGRQEKYKRAYKMMLTTEMLQEFTSQQWKVKALWKTRNSSSKNGYVEPCLLEKRDGSWNVIKPMWFYH